MLRLLCPSLFVESVEAIDFPGLAERGYRAVIIDADNTLVAWGAYESCSRLERLLGDLKAAGFRCCILSNSRSRRLKRLVAALGVPAVVGAAKPRSGSFRAALKLLGARADETVVIGDQLFTDVLGGNRLGMFTVLVRPIDSREFVWTRVMRLAERAVLTRLKRAGMLPDWGEAQAREG